MSSRNNRARTTKDNEVESSVLDPAPEAQTPPPQPLSFAIPTEFVDLPSRGLYYPHNHNLHGVETIEIKHMTAKEEDLLASQSLIKKGIAIDRMLQSLIVDEDIQIKDLLLGDRNALTVAARITGYGADYLTHVVCPSCQTEQDFSFDLNENQTVGAGFDKEVLNDKLSGVEVTDTGTFLINLPKSQHQVEIRLMTGVDEENLENFQTRKNRKGQEESPLTDTLKTIIIGVDGSHDRNTIMQFVDCMPAMDSRHLRKIYAELIPNIDMTQDFSCHKCGHQQALEVPVTTDFFWPR
jgi:hypothetical protein